MEVCFCFPMGILNFITNPAKYFNWVGCLFVCLNFSRLLSKDVLLRGGREGRERGREEGREGGRGGREGEREGGRERGREGGREGRGTRSWG